MAEWPEHSSTLTAVIEVMSTSSSFKAVRYYIFSFPSAAMRLDTDAFRYLGKEEMRVLTAIEMGQKNHQLVPLGLIESIANFRRGGVMPFIRELHKFKLIYHDSRPYEGYRLTYSGYDCLALQALSERGILLEVGRRIGVGKESDVHLSTIRKESVEAEVSDDGSDSASEENGVGAAVVKFHRLGRVSFRTVKQNRDYLGNRKHASWMYMARLAAAKEFHYAKLLHSLNFPVPKPLDWNRHCILMDHVDGMTLYQLSSNDLEVEEAEKLLNDIYKLILRLGAVGIIHGDLNEFNLIVNVGTLSIYLIDFPQVVHINHVNAEYYFQRDVEGVTTFFQKKFGVGLRIDDIPTFAQASGAFTTEAASQVKMTKFGDGSDVESETHEDRLQSPVLVES
jgi:RIO kinase 2